MRTLLFDFDGTIADSFDVVVDIFYELTGHARITDQAEVARLRKQPMMRVAKELHVSPIQIPRLLIKGRKMMHDKLTKVPVFDGIAAALRSLQAEGYNLYVMSSNSTQNVRAFLVANKLDTYFDDVYGNIGLLNKAAAIRKVLRQNGVQPHQCVYIGDESRDIDGAKKAGVGMVSVAWGYNDVSLLREHNPDVIVMHPNELVSAIKKV
jgi:phosphoglycolate phosphatase-like HAD superfamily hydrolase